MTTFSNLSEFPKRIITGSFLVALFGSAYLVSSILFSLLLMLVAGIILYSEWPALVDMQNKYCMLISLIYPVTPLIGLICLNAIYHDIAPLIPLYPFFVAWIADTCGYLVGKCCGKTKICPRISPGKTCEGLIGSFFGVLSLHFFIDDKLFFIPYNSSLMPRVTTIAIISLLMTGVAFLGGLFLSWLKRHKKVKDAGSLLPGHGGLLDRFDGVLAVTLVVVILVLFHALRWAA